MHSDLKPTNRQPQRSTSDLVHAHRTADEAVYALTSSSVTEQLKTFHSRAASPAAPSDVAWPTRLDVEIDVEGFPVVGPPGRAGPRRHAPLDGGHGRPGDPAGGGGG